MTTAAVDRPPLCGHAWPGPCRLRQLGGPHSCAALAEVHRYNRHRCYCGATTREET